MVASSMTATERGVSNNGLLKPNVALLISFARARGASVLTSMSLNAALSAAVARAAIADWLCDVEGVAAEARTTIVLSFAKLHCRPVRANVLFKASLTVPWVRKPRTRRSDTSASS
jgi:hypothetical protein